MGKGLAKKVAALALVVCVAFGIIGFGQSQLEMAPLNPAFKRYLEAVQAGRSVASAGPEGYNLGYIPSPVDLSHIPRVKVSDRDRFPSYYDLRTLGQLISIKDQRGCGFCWAFVTIISLA